MNTTDKVYLARQPILTADYKNFAYELLFRNPPANFAEVEDAMQATARVLVNTLNSVGTQALVGKSKAFVNCDRTMLLEKAFEPLDPKTFVLEILEDVVGDPEVVEAVKGLKDMGFEIALDDFIMTTKHVEKCQAFFPLVSYVKVDLMANNIIQIRDSASFFRKMPHIKLLAEKVESERMFLDCHHMGYTYFQGYFFAKPELVEGRKLDPKTAGVMQLLQLLSKDPEISELENAFKRQAEVTVNLLKFINSAAIGMRTHIDSIRQALAMIGQRKLQQWLMLLLFAGGGPSANASTTSPLFENATQRARFMENLARIVDPRGSLHEKAFLVGMLSRMDALCKVKLETILKEFDLGEDLSNALREHKGILGDLLMITTAAESDDLDVMMGLCFHHGIKHEQMQSALTESWTWAESVKT